MLHFRPSLVSLVLTTATLAAQTWNETVDAPGTLLQAQACAGNGQLNAILGVLSNDVDVYLIQVAYPSSFSAAVSASFDSQLFLFDEQGFGVTANDDWQQGASAHLSGTNLVGPGRYYLAITGYDVDPVAANGEIWNDGTMFEENPPNGPGAREVCRTFSGAGGYYGSYSILLTGCRLVGKQLVLPDNHHFCENPAGLGSAGTTNYWRTTPGRFQLIYDASHFLSAGVDGPIALQNLLFRTEDGEPGARAVFWNNVTVRVGSTSLTGATMSADFATNLGAGTTTMGNAGTGLVQVENAVGSTPNNWNVSIDLVALGAAITHDPTSTRPNLLIDVVMPSSVNQSIGYPFPTFQDTTGGLTTVRGRGLYATGATATTGTLSTAPLVVGLEFAGNGGAALPVPARNETYGAACGGNAASFYQSFVNGQRFDLGGLTMTPDNNVWPSYYLVNSTAPGVDLSKAAGTPVSVADDAVVTHPLGFTFNYPGGQVTSIDVSTNGFVWLMGPGAAEPIPSPDRLRGAVANGGGRLAPCWYDFHCGRNTSLPGNSGLHVFTDTSGGPGHAVCWVTWKSVGVFNSVAASGIASYTFQCVLFQDTGVVQFRYAKMPRFCSTWSVSTEASAAIVGFSPGFRTLFASIDPQSRDLSLDGTFTTDPVGSEGNQRVRLSSFTSPASLDSDYGGRFVPGDQVRWRVENIAGGTMIGVQLLDVGPSQPGLQVPGITAAGCRLGVTTNTLVWEVQVMPGPTVIGSVPFTVPAGYDGTSLYAQYVVLGGLFGAPDLITAASQAIKHTIGQR